MFSQASLLLLFIFKVSLSIKQTLPYTLYCGCKETSDLPNKR